MFERKPMEQIVEKMITWTRGTTSKLTDFRVGSKTRTLFESVAVVIEELYDKVYRSLRKIIEENIYSVIGFDKLPATYASGIAQFSRSTPAEENFLIPAGTVVMSNPTDFKLPIRYRTTDDYVLEIGQTSIDIPIISETAGTRGNAGINEIVVFVNKPTGIEDVTNPSALVSGKEEETQEEQKARFNQFIEANARGILQSVEYGAKLAQRTDEDGSLLERVYQAVAIEDLPTRKGEVDLYIWNGVGASTTELKDTVNKLLIGYYDEDDNPVYGYKPAGIQVNLYDAGTIPLDIQVYAEAEEWTTLDEMKPLIEGEIDRYFGSLKLGQTFIQTALEANIKYIEGIYDCKLYTATDGVTFTTDNVSIQKWEICTANKPLTYL